MGNNRKIFQCDVDMDKPYLHIPVQHGVEASMLRLFTGGRLLYSFRIGLSEQEPHTYYPLCLKDLMGTTVHVEVITTQDVTGSMVDKIQTGNEPERETTLYPDLFMEKYRPKFHYSCKRGWLNDPNGLHFSNGIYHLYYQHNPLGPTATDMNCSWGHATSTDLFHWEEHSPAIMPPNEKVMCASGSCIKDEKDVLGYGKNTVVAAFTALGVENLFTWKKSNADGQYLAVSTDDGYTFRLMPDQPKIPCDNGEPWRDPCLFQYNNSYGIAVYEIHNKKNEVAFYRSDDLINWERTGFVADLFECPDMFPLTCDDTGESRWVLYGGDGRIRIGEFNGQVFIDSGIHNPLDFGRATYAGQTWRDVPGNRRIHIAWACGMGNHRIWDERGMGYEGMPFSQCMTVPCELKLRYINNRYMVTRTPARELNALRTSNGFAVPLSDEGTIQLEECGDYNMVFRNEKSFSFSVSDLKFSFDPETRILQFPNNNKWEMNSSRLCFRILADTTTIEMFFNDILSATYTMPISEAVFYTDEVDEIFVLRYSLKNIHAK